MNKHENCKGEWLNGRATVSKTVGCVFESRLPCQKKSLGLLFLFIRDSNTQRIRDGTMSVRLRLHVTRRFANTFASLCYFSRFALSRVASLLPKEVLSGFFFHLFENFTVFTVHYPTIIYHSLSNNFFVLQRNGKLCTMSL